MKLSLLLAFVATTIVSVLATEYVPTCQLSSLVLKDKNTGLPLNIHDSNGNPFSPNKYRTFRASSRSKAEQPGVRESGAARTIE